jgi:hypothetical protein
MNNSYGHLHTIDQIGLHDFVNDREGALSIIEQLRGGANQRWSFDLVLCAITALFEQHGQNQSYKLPANEKLTVLRARKLESDHRAAWPSSANQLGPRDAQSIDNYGRCHRPKPKQSIGYFAFYEQIALSEIDAQQGDCIVIATYQLIDELITVPIGELDYFRRTGETYLGSLNEKAKDAYSSTLKNIDENLRSFVDAFFAEEFIKPASTVSDYKITAALSELVLNHPGLSEPVDAIFYPSVAFRAGYNLAVQANAVTGKMKLLVAETKIVKVREVLGYGIFETDELSNLKEINKDAQLIWS